MKSTTRNVLMFAWPAILALVIFLLYQFGVGEKNTAGAKLYRAHCANCHADDGSGLRGLYPPLSGADYLSERTPLIPCMIRNGVSGEMVVNGRTYKQVMPANQLLTDQEISILINYIRNTWENDLGEIAFSEIEAQLEACPQKK